jgi:hypothetical protein
MGEVGYQAIMGGIGMTLQSRLHTLFLILRGHIAREEWEQAYILLHDIRCIMKEER